MKLDKAAQLAEIIGSVAIVVTLVVLVVELRGNTAALQAVNLGSLAARTQQISLDVAANGELAEIQARLGNKDVAAQRTESYLISVLKLAEEAFLQYQAGLLEEKYWITRANLALFNLQTSEAREMLDSFREAGVLVPEFVAWLDAASAERQLDETR